MQPILPITVPTKTIKGAAYQCYVGGDVVIQCEQTFTANGYIELDIYLSSKLSSNMNAKN